LIQSWTKKTVKISERVKADLEQEVEGFHVAGEVQTLNKGGTTMKRGNFSVNRWWLELRGGRNLQAHSLEIAYSIS
jgi:hypothetical protein